MYGKSSSVDIKTAGYLDASRAFKLQYAQSTTQSH